MNSDNLDKKLDALIQESVSEIDKSNDDYEQNSDKEEDEVKGTSLEEAIKQLQEATRNLEYAIKEKDWSKGVDAEEGKMHRLLDISQDEQIEDHYDSGEKLADDLVKATNDEKEAAGMINYAANLSGSQLFKDAQKAIAKKDYSE